MPSINLLPENFIIEAYKKREKTAIYILSVVFLSSSLAVYGLADLDRRTAEKTSTTLDTQVAQTKQQINAEIKKSELLSSDFNKKDIEKILSEHPYLSKIVGFPRGLLVQDAYASEMSYDTASSVLKMNLSIKDYDSFLQQVAIFKDSFWIDSFKLGSVTRDLESGNLEVGVELTLRKDMVSFQEQYHDFALGILADKANRFVKISSYNVVLKQGAGNSAQNDGASQAKQAVEVTFQGEAYDKDHLDAFEKSLNDMEEVGKLTLVRSDPPDNKPGVINFQGTMDLNY